MLRSWFPDVHVCIEDNSASTIQLLSQNQPSSSNASPSIMKNAKAMLGEAVWKASLIHREDNKPADWLV